DKILEIDVEEHTATIEPGVILSGLNKALAKHSLQFGPDPASAERATMGGVIANNATGAHSILYGMAADHILQADVVLADGSLAVWGQRSVREEAAQGDTMSRILGAVHMIRDGYAQAVRERYPRSWRNSAGYRLNYLLPWSPSEPPLWRRQGPARAVGDYPPVQPETLNLAALLAGSEGTLAVIRRAKVNLVPRPPHSVLAVLGYSDIARACDDVPRLLRCEPSAIELIPQSIVRLAQSVPAYAAQAAVLAIGAEALLAVEFSGDDPARLRAAALALGPAVLAEGREDQARIWNVRKVGLGLLASRTGDAKTVAFIEDCAIPVEKLGDFVRGIERILAEHGVRAEYYAHASAGCLHIRPILDLKKQAYLLRQIGQATLELTLSLGGSMSSEHGDGLARSEWLRRTYGDEVVAAFSALKQAADPKGILNPGKILDAPPMDSHLRYGPEYRARAWTSGLAFTREGGLAAAIEQCNGQGVCRKFDGTMCPSFQATREEMYSTRGRANLLRSMISRGDRPGEGEQASPEDVHAALDLCLACKGCKSECPSGVDMAKLKYAFWDEYYRTHLRPLSDYLFGYFHLTCALLAPIAPLANAIMKFAPTGRLIAQLTGITTERPFPRFSSQRAHVHRASGSGPGRKVLFLSDSFTHYIEPQVEQAAFDVLERMGFKVTVLPLMGAGASLLSKGFIKPARRHAQRVLGSIRRADPSGTAMVVGLEPPEIYTLKNDYTGLLLEEQGELGKLSERAWLLDEFLLRSDSFNSLRIAIKGGLESSGEGRRLKFQPHCHQRAEAPAADGLPCGAAATLRVLSLCGFDVELIDSGCCGMAGTFGYEAEHYDLSMKVAELKLLPAIEAARSAGEEPRLVSTGSACRLQIEQGSGILPEHSVVTLARYLRGATPPN
ncbi:MAG: FAD-binding and (Fe-S)-binding domain-containing protein, partial [Bacteroidota bacterium]